MLAALLIAELQEAIFCSKKAEKSNLEWWKGKKWSNQMPSSSYIKK